MNWTIRTIQENDNPSVAQVIRRVMPEFGADREGFAFCDPEVDGMWQAYEWTGQRSTYFVVEVQDSAGRRVVGGAGVAPLVGETTGKVCELRKMYILKEMRGLGVGRELMQRCLAAAREFGFASCYIETLATMTAARKLYEGFGFQYIENARGDTGHHGCDIFMEQGL